jgi:hypothetical protein
MGSSSIDLDSCTSFPAPTPKAQEPPQLRTIFRYDWVKIHFYVKICLLVDSRAEREASHAREVLEGIGCGTPGSGRSFLPAGLREVENATTLNIQMVLRQGRVEGEEVGQLVVSICHAGEPRTEGDVDLGVVWDVEGVPNIVQALAQNALQIKG